MFSQEEGKIRRFDDEAQEKKSDTTHSVHTPSSSSTNTDNTTDSFDANSIVDAFQAIGFIGRVVEAVGYATIGTLFQFSGEDSTFHNNTFWTRGFTEYPYFDPTKGVYSIGSYKTFAFSFSGHRFSDGNNLTGYSGRLFVSPHQALNLEAQVIDLAEKLSTKTDHLRLYNFFMDYNRVKSENISLWWGLGIKGMNGPTVNEMGPALNSGIEIFPFAPVSVSVNYNVGFINSNSLHDFSFEGSLYYNRYNLSVGYQQFTVGNAVMDGMIFGISAHF